jgi:16S rRNA processing protein RimM
VPQPPEAWVWLARIRRPQGRKGEVFAEILTDFPDKFATRLQLWLLPPEEATNASQGPRPLAPDVSAAAGSLAAPRSPRRVELNNHWLHKGGVVLHFAGVESISAAEGLNGMIVAIPGAERVALAGDEAYISDLIGCTLVNVAGVEPVTVGEIVDVDRSMGAAPLLVVRDAKGEVLVPFAKSYLRRIDLEAKCVEMALPEGLVDLSKAEEA